MTIKEADMRNLGWVAVAIGSIWVAVLIISLFSSDLVYGADNDTFPLIAATTWIWGANASTFVLRALAEQHPNPSDQRHAWIGLAIAVSTIWLLVTVASLVIPDFDFDSGSTMVTIPLGAVIAPIAGAVVTSIACQFVPRLTFVAAIAGNLDNQRLRESDDTNDGF